MYSVHRRTRTSISLVALLASFVSVPCIAANFYVSQGATGANNGADWTNAFNELSQVNWAVVNPGDTIWIAGGTYATSLTPLASGTLASPILVRRVEASDAVPVAAAGWSASFDSQVLVTTNQGIKWSSQVPGTGSYVTIDGRIDSGIKCVAADSDPGAGVYINTGNTGVILQYVEMAGPAGSVPYTFNGDGSALYVNSTYGTVVNLTVTYCRMHGAVNECKLLSAQGTTFDHCWFYDNLAINLATYHTNIVSTLASTGITVFRYNQVTNWENEGILMQGATAEGEWDIYGNVWHDGVVAEFSRVLESQQVANGPILFYANTIVNSWEAIREANGGSFATGSQGRNNIYWNISGYQVGLPDNDYDFFDVALPVPLTVEAHGIGNGSNPFLNYIGGDYRLISTFGPTYPRSNGLDLPAQFGPDINGAARPGNPSPWDIGAYQSVPVAPTFTTQPPSNQTVNFGTNITLTASVVGQPPPSYQWNFNGVPISGATSSSLALNSVTPANNGSYTLTASNGIGPPVTSTAESLTVLFPPPTIISSASAGGTQFQPFSYTISASNTPTSYSAIGLPAGLTIDTASGIISGIPPSFGTYNVTILATNAGGSGSANLVLTIQQAIYAGIYFGTFGSGGNWAFYIRTDNTGIFISYVGGVPTVQNIIVNPEGFFVVPNAGVTVQSVAGTRTATLSSFPYRINILGAIVAGTAGSDYISGTLDAGTSEANLAGFYHGVGLLGISGNIYSVVGGDGQVFLVEVQGTSSDAAGGILGGANGSLTGVTVNGGMNSVTVNAFGQIFDTYTLSGSSAPVSFSGIANSISATTRLINLSARANCGNGSNVLIVGFNIIGGTKSMLLRGVGPTLSQFGVTGVLADPTLSLYSGAALIQSNDNWGGSPSLVSAFTQVGAFALPSNSADSALVTSLNPGGYTTQVSGNSGQTGIGLAECYDADTGPSPSGRLSNISARAQVGVGSNVLIGGFVISGNAPEQVLIRAIGPTLAQFGVTGALMKPQLTLVDSNNKALLSNSGWGGTSVLSSAFAQAGAFTLPTTSADAALFVTLAPGSYTAQVASVDGSTGVALIEIYEVP